MRLFVGVILLASFAFAKDLDLNQFDKKFKVLISDDAEKGAEAKRLKEVEDEIDKENKKFAEGKESFKEKLYPFSDLSKEEFKKEKTGLVPDPQGRVIYAKGLQIPPESERVMTPEMQAKVDELYARNRGWTPRSFSSQSKGWVTKARSQDNCGSCAAFAAHGLHEVCMAKAGAPIKNLDLSEQHIIDCAYGYKRINGCHGALPWYYTEWFKNQGGMSLHEGDYPYLDTSPKLNCYSANRIAKWNSGAKVASHVYDWQCTEDKLKKMVAENGAVTVGLEAADDFMNYEKGVMDKCKYNAKPDHAVLVVGYGREGGKDYWLIKNSWGDNWGDHGFAKIVRGRNCNAIVNLGCGSASCRYSGSPDTAPTTPKPKPVPLALYCDLSKGSYSQYHPINGSYNLRTTDPTTGKTYTAEVRCKNSICTPQRQGPVNACMYICGQTKC